MGKSEFMTGNPWHVELMTRADGDDKRHRAHCRYYDSRTKRCSYYMKNNCNGSAHCSAYIDKRVFGEADRYVTAPEPPKTAVRVPLKRNVNIPGLKINATVIHKTYGTGWIYDYDMVHNRIYVCFETCDKAFVVPDVFKKGLLEILQDY